ncbi:MAG: hypothetical protein L3J92_04240 [Thermoplasmata archaeon]|jgi:hypothetical protein|nr:hypothetical protein [Thermoplasmata archaeon]
MTGFRGSDDSLDREIAAIERMARTRVRRVASELNEIERDLRELKRERSRRRTTAVEESAGRVTVRETA